MHSMQSAIYFFNNSVRFSVRPSVRLSVLLWYCILTNVHRKTFLSIWLSRHPSFVRPSPLQNPRGTLGTKCRVWEKL